MPYFVTFATTGTAHLLESAMDESPVFKEAVRGLIRNISNGDGDLVFYSGAVKR